MKNFRTLRERALQTLCFETIGVVLVTPLYMWSRGAEAHEGATLIIAISVAVMIWAPLYSLVFDMLEQRRCNRVASDRPHRLRVVHAVGYEVTCVAVTLPLAMVIGGLSLTQAAGLNIQLTLFYIVYAYVFFLVYDRLRPVGVQVRARQSVSTA